MFGSRQVRRALLVLSVLSVASCEHGPSVTAPPPAPGAPSFSTSAFTGTGSAVNGRFAHVAMRLSDGRVLVAGGARFNQACADPPAGNSTEIYDPATGAWTLTGTLTQSRTSGLAVALADGRVLFAGGGSRCGVVSANADIYNPATGVWTATGAMNVAR